MSEVLILQTERLLLRPFELEEASVAAYNSRQPIVSREMSDMVLVDEAAGLEWINWINRISNTKAPWQVLAIELKSEKHCIGFVGVIPQQKIQGEVEILFSISDNYQNNGYATEAANELKDWFFSTREGSCLCAIVKVQNIPSQRVIEKLGFRFVEERKIEYDGVLTDFKYYKLTPPQ